MIGAIIGDIVGSRFEWHNHRSKDFDLLTHKCFFTDDSVMSLAVCDALMKCKADYSDLSEQAVHSMQNVGRLILSAATAVHSDAGCIPTIRCLIIVTAMEQQ